MREPLVGLTQQTAPKSCIRPQPHLDVDVSDVGSYLYNTVTFQQLHFSNAKLSKFYFSLALVLKFLEFLHICCVKEGTFILEEGVKSRHLEKMSF